MGRGKQIDHGAQIVEDANKLENLGGYKVMCFVHKGLVSHETPAAPQQLNIN